MDSAGNVYIGDQTNHRVRKITASTSIITTIAGTGTSGYSGNGGQATSATIKYPCGINLDSSGNVYFGDYSAFNVIRKITVSTGIISTVAGTGSTSGGYNGDNIQATAATLSTPWDPVVDSDGNIYISDSANNRVRKVDVLTGLITTFVGTGSASSSGDGAAATNAAVNGPIYSRFDSNGNLYISEGDGNRIRKVVSVSTEIPTMTPSSASPTYNPSARPSTEQPSYTPSIIPSISPTVYPSQSPSIGIVTTIAGTGVSGYNGDNRQAISATLHYPRGVALDSSGISFILLR